MEYELVITPTAVSEILAICDYIANDSPQNAAKVGGRIYSTIETVRKFPQIGGSAKERFGLKMDFQYFVVLPYTYIIFYKVVGQKLYVGHVIDGRRDCVRVLTLTQKNPWGQAQGLLL